MIKVSNFLDVKKKAQELGCNIPTSIAILPRNFDSVKSKDELIHEDTAPTVRVLWRQNNIVETPLEYPGEKFPQAAEEALEWTGPIIFIPTLLISQNPYLITIAINVISNYLTDWFKGILPLERKVKLRVVIETSQGNYKEIEYEGTEDGLRNLPKIIKEVHTDGREN
jgi:hypothetical protein